MAHQNPEDTSHARYSRMLDIGTVEGVQFGMVIGGAIDIDMFKEEYSRKPDVETAEIRVELGKKALKLSSTNPNY